MDLNQLAERLAEKAKASGKHPQDETEQDGPRNAGAKSGSGRGPKLPSEQRAAVAKKATAARSSAPRRSGK